jgi:putative endopeptidase
MLPARHWLRMLALASIVAAAGCGERATEPAATTAATPVPSATPAAAPTPAFGTFGLDEAGMDKTVAPGDDFFAHANGTWVRTFEIPADRSRYSMFTLLAEKALARNRAILEEAAARPNAAGEEKLVGDFYAAFMDEAAIEKLDGAPIKADLDRIAALADKAALAGEIGATLRADVDLLNATDLYTDRPFGIWINQHLDRPEETVPYLVQGGLGLPDRDFYLEAGRFAELRPKYEAFIAQLFDLAGIADGAKKAAGVLALETKIAQVHATQVETNDIKRGANFWPRAEFAQRAPGLDWDALFAAAGLSGANELVVWQEGATKGIARLAGSEPLDTWKDYLQFHALLRGAPLLSKRFADAHFAFMENTLNGTPQQQDRWKRGINAANEAIGDAVGKLYVARHFSAETKAHAERMVADLVTAFGQRIDRLDWMSDATKARAKQKLAGLGVAVGYPDAWRDYTGLELRRDDAYGNAQRASAFEYRRNLAKLGKPQDRGEWYMLPQTVNALNVPLENRLIFPAAILEAPFFDAAADDAINYGAIGAVIGHEISHSFDSSGALFDEKGRLANWWTPEDFAKFEAAGQKLVAQYDQYEAFPDLKLNGKLTLGENIADLSGLATAYDGYKLSLRGQPGEVIGGYTPDQRLFLGYAQVWRSKYREPALRNLILTDGHSPGPWRVANVRNQDAWYAAFDVKEGTKLHLAPEQRVRVW